RFEIDCRVLPHAAAKRLVGIAELLQRGLLRVDVAMHVLTGRIMRGPDAGGILRDGVEVPHLLARVRVVGPNEAADTIFAAVGADEDFAVDRGRSHCLAIALLRIGDLRLPYDAAGLGVQRHELRIEGRHVDLVAVYGDATIVWTAAIGRDWTHLMLVVPVLL